MHIAPAFPENLLRLRLTRNMGQEQLAEASQVSVDTIARIERGERQTTRATTVARLAAALGVSSDALLTGNAPPHSDEPDATMLRRAVTMTGDVAGLDCAEESDVDSMAGLTGNTHRSWRYYVAGQHVALMAALPALLIDARRATDTTDENARTAAHRLLSTAYRLAAGLAGRYGLDDLAWTAAERALYAARQSDTPDIQEAISLRFLVWTLVRQGRTHEAEQVGVAAAEKVEPRMLDRDPERAGVFGNLIFNAATAAQRSGSPDRAHDLLAVAQSAAVRSGVDSATEAAIFGPRVAGLQAVDHALRANDPETALRLADRLPTARGVVPAFWEAGHRLHLARAAVELRRDRAALSYLADARTLAPDWVRCQPLGTSTMCTLLDRAPRRRGSELAGLAAHYSAVTDSSGSLL